MNRLCLAVAVHFDCAKLSSIDYIYSPLQSEKFRKQFCVLNIEIPASHVRNGL